MGRPNYQRIIQVHGKLPDGLMADFGLKVITSEAEGTAKVVDATPDEMKPAVEPPAGTPDYSVLEDKETGKKLMAMGWAELKSKATKDGVFKQGMKKKDILEAYLALPAEQTA